MKLTCIILRLRADEVTASSDWNTVVLSRVRTLLSQHASSGHLLCSVRILLPDGVAFEHVHIAYGALAYTFAALPFVHLSVFRVQDVDYTEAWEEYPVGWEALWGDALEVVTYEGLDESASVLKACPDNSDAEVIPGVRPLAIPASAVAWGSIAFGGTFDGLHAGHRLALDALIEVATQSTSPKDILFGVSRDEVLLNKPGGAVAQTYNTRLSILRRTIGKMLQCRGYQLTLDGSIDESKRVKAIRSRYMTVVDVHTTRGLPVGAAKPTSLCVVFTDLDAGGIGVAGDTEDLDCLILTTETMKGGALVNDFRAGHGLAPVATVVCPLVRADALADTAKLSSRDERRVLLAWLESHGNERCLEKLGGRWGVSEEKKRAFLRYYLLPLCVAGRIDCNWEDAMKADELSEFIAHLLPCIPDSRLLAEWLSLEEKK